MHRKMDICIVIGVCMFLAVGAVSLVSAAPINMKFSTFTGPVHPLSPALKTFCKKLTEASKGQVVVQLYESEALGKSFDHKEMVRGGLAEFGIHTCTFTQADFPLFLFSELPFSTPSGPKMNKLYMELIKRGFFEEEFKKAGVKLVAPVITPALQIFSNKRITNLEDFNGMRITGFGPIFAETWKTLGATTVAIGYADVYTALQRGTLDGALTAWGASQGWKWPEVAKYAVDISLMGGWSVAILMNPNSWNKLPPDVKQAWTKVFDECQMLFADAFASAEEPGYKAWVEAGREIVKISDKERSRLAEGLIPVWQSWINRNEAEGRPGKKMYQAYVEIMKKMGEPVIMKIPGLYQE